MKSFPSSKVLEILIRRSRKKQTAADRYKPAPQRKDCRNGKYMIKKNLHYLLNVTYVCERYFNSPKKYLLYFVHFIIFIWVLF